VTVGNGKAIHLYVHLFIYLFEHAIARTRTRCCLTALSSIYLFIYLIAYFIIIVVVDTRPRHPFTYLFIDFRPCTCSQLDTQLLRPFANLFIYLTTRPCGVHWLARLSMGGAQIYLFIYLPIHALSHSRAGRHVLVTIYFIYFPVQSMNHPQHLPHHWHTGHMTHRATCRSTGLFIYLFVRSNTQLWGMGCHPFVHSTINLFIWACGCSHTDTVLLHHAVFNLFIYLFDYVFRHHNDHGNEAAPPIRKLIYLFVRPCTCSQLDTALLRPFANLFIYLTMRAFDALRFARLSMRGARIYLFIYLPVHAPSPSRACRHVPEHQLIYLFFCSVHASFKTFCRITRVLGMLNLFLIFPYARRHSLPPYLSNWPQKCQNVN